MVFDVLRCAAIARRFPGYQPRLITRRIVHRYVKQFERKDREMVYQMLELVQNIPRADAQRHLIANLLNLLDRTDGAGVLRENIFMVPATSQGQGSAEMLDLLEESEAFQLFGISVHRGTTLELRKLLRNADTAVVIFVDDFVGSGGQFEGSFGAWRTAVDLPSVTSILMTIVMCPEAQDKVRSLGVEASYAILHGTNDRFEGACKGAMGDLGYEVLASYARELHSKIPFGHREMGCLTIVYRNSNNNVPFLLRGSKGQRVWLGMFPRHDQIAPA